MSVASREVGTSQLLTATSPSQSQVEEKRVRGIWLKRICSRLQSNRGEPTREKGSQETTGSMQTLTWPLLTAASSELRIAPGMWWAFKKSCCYYIQNGQAMRSYCTAQGTESSLLQKNMMEDNLRKQLYIYI